MNNNSPSCELEKAGKKRPGEDTAATFDRLSHLPDPIIHHILSFLDTKSTVQTSVLSRVWRCAWKHVPVLDFESDWFDDYSSFERFVENVLSLRYPSNVSKVTYIDSDDYAEVEEEEEEEKGEGGSSLCGKVIKYTLSHDAQHLVIDLHYIRQGDGDEGYRFSNLFSTILDSNLKTLKFRNIRIGSGFGSAGFGMLTTLEVGYCVLVSDQDGDFDPFSGLPCLQSLVLTRVDHVLRDGIDHGRRTVNISGPQLLSLTLEELLCYKMEIFAPRLKFFSLRHNLSQLKFSKLTFPFLDHAVLRINDDDFILMEGREKFKAQTLISLFQGLRNIISLELDYPTFKVLSKLSEFLEQEHSPFTRLKSLIVRADGIPHSLANYFLKGSSSTEQNIEFV